MELEIGKNLTELIGTVCFFALLAWSARLWHKH